MTFMRNSIFILLLVISFFVQIVGQTSAKETQNKLLEVSVSDSKVNYCERGNVYVVFDIAFKNVGKTPLIVYKNLFIPNKIMVFENDNVQMKKEPTQRTVGLVSFAKYSYPEKEFDGELFSILQPQEKMTLKNMFFSVTIPTEKLRHGLKSKNHFASINLVTFPFYRADEIKLRSKWSKFGYLWADDLIITNIKFSIDDAEHDIQGCENYMESITKK